MRAMRAAGTKCVLLSDITALYVARHGAPMFGTAVFIRTCQHTDGWTDLPIVASVFVPAA